MKTNHKKKKKKPPKDSRTEGKTSENEREAIDGRRKEGGKEEDERKGRELEQE